jgi:hypothetical protein
MSFGEERILRANCRFVIISKLIKDVPACTVLYGTQAPILAVADC